MKSADETKQAAIEFADYLESGRSNITRCEINDKVIWGYVYPGKAERLEYFDEDARLTEEDWLKMAKYLDGSVR